jgi:hypothetical protein
MIASFNELVLFFMGLNKSIQKVLDIVLKRYTSARWLSLSSLLESVDLSIGCVQSILFKLSSNQQSLKLTKINVNGLADLINLLSVIKQVSI